MYRIYVYCGTEEDREPYWHDCEEGPFDTYNSAAQFAVAEVGQPWVVVNEHGYPLSFGDGLGMQGGRKVKWED